VRRAASRACDPTHALPGLRPPGRLDGPAGTVCSLEGRRTARAAPGGRAAATEPKTEARPGRPRGARRAGPAAPQAATDEPARHAGHAAGLPPAAGPLALDLSPPGRQADGRCRTRSADRADGARESGLGLHADPRRTTRLGDPRRRLHGAQGAETAADSSRAAAQPHHLAAVPAHPGLGRARVRLLPRRLRGHPASRVRVLRPRGQHSPCACPGRDRAPGWRLDHPAGPESADGPGGSTPPGSGS
jgi:hypothetical protein